MRLSIDPLRPVLLCVNETEAKHERRVHVSVHLFHWMWLSLVLVERIGSEASPERNLDETGRRELVELLLGMCRKPM